MGALQLAKGIAAENRASGKVDHMFKIQEDVDAQKYGVAILERVDAAKKMRDSAAPGPAVTAPSTSVALSAETPKI